MKGFIKKNFLPLVVAGAIALGSGGTVIFHKIASTPSDTRVENEVGTDDFIPGFIASDQFSILDAGNHKDFGTLFLDQKLDYCRDNGISCGIKVHIDTDSLGSVYEDVDYHVIDGAGHGFSGSAFDEAVRYVFDYLQQIEII